VKITAAIAFVGLTIVTGPSYAWDNFGHMEVAAVAWGKLTPAAGAQAAQLLTLNPMYASWTNNVPAQERDQIAFIMAATWPDAIKRASDYHSDGSAGGDHHRTLVTLITLGINTGTSSMSRSLPMERRGAEVISRS
jgi:hypothetical protein